MSARELRVPGTPGIARFTSRHHAGFQRRKLNVAPVPNRAGRSGADAHTPRPRQHRGLAAQFAKRLEHVPACHREPSSDEATSGSTAGVGGPATPRAGRARGSTRTSGHAAGHPPSGATPRLRPLCPRAAGLRLHRRASRKDTGPNPRRRAGAVAAEAGAGTSGRQRACVGLAARAQEEPRRLPRGPWGHVVESRAYVSHERLCHKPSEDVLFTCRAALKRMRWCPYLRDNPVEFRFPI